jgi:hypothetical protein
VFAHGLGDASEHGQGLPLVVGVLGVADHRRRRAYALGQLPLGEVSLGASEALPLMDLAGSTLTHSTLSRTVHPAGLRGLPSPAMGP